MTAATFPVHPIAEKFPLLEGADFDALVEDIREHGQLHPIVVHHGTLLDGRNRLRACEVLGIEPIVEEWSRSNGASPAEWIVSTNLHRRHLTREQRREAVATLLRLDPRRSNRSIAKALGVDDKTVGSVRDDLEDGAEIPHHDVRVGSDGVEQPATKPRGALSDLESQRPKELEAVIQRGVDSGHPAFQPEAPRPAPPREPSREEQNRTSRANGYAQIGRLVAFASVVASEKNIRFYVELLLENREEFYADQRFLLERVVESAEIVATGMPRFVEELKSRMEEDHATA